ncbi:hypothetical protein ACQ4PT_053047 [Festuca glaucescens]
MCDSWTGPSRMSIINFMVFCNGRMHFHKSVNATGCVQNHQYVLEQIKKVVVNEIGEKFVVQIVTDNGSNFKKACKELCKEYPHITWQPCAAHTINLMLKEIGGFPEVDAVVTSAKRICRFFYNHSTLHAEMHDQIDGELVRPNATRFWWDDVEWVLNVVRPIYTVLRYADSQVAGSLAGFMPRIMQARHELSSLFEEGSADQKKYLDVVDKRVTHLCDDTLMVAAGLLDPQGHYKFKLASDRIRQRAFTKAIMKIADPEDAIEAIEQFGQYSSFRGNFDTQMVRDGASRLSPTQWWLSFGGDVGTLQKYALRIVSQCTSSSGCERNWSTFALIHTQVRNRLGYEKLHKLVYVHYNLQLRVLQIVGEMKERELDPCGMMLNATLYDNANPIMDWLTNSRSESEPLLDADDYDEDAAAAYEDDYNNRLPTPTHDVVDPVLIEEPLMRPINKRKTRTVNAPVIEEEDEEEVEAESDDDMEDNGENEELPLDDNAPPRQMSIRRRTKSRKLLDTDITSTTSRKEGKSH